MLIGSFRQEPASIPAFSGEMARCTLPDGRCRMQRRSVIVVKCHHNPVIQSYRQSHAYEAGGACHRGHRGGRARTIRYRGRVWRKKLHRVKTMIGIPRETAAHARRVALTPDGVKKYVAAGVTVLSRRTRAKTLISATRRSRTPEPRSSKNLADLQQFRPDPEGPETHHRGNRRDAAWFRHHCVPFPHE